MELSQTRDCADYKAQTDFNENYLFGLYYPLAGGADPGRVQSVGTATSPGQEQRG